jgi:hypothetical protein
MKTSFAIIAGSALTAAASAGSVSPFTETFEDGASNWLDSGFAPATEVATGGVDNSAYITGQTGFEFSDSGDFNVVFRGNPGLFPGTDASDGAFIGDWISSGVTNFSFDIRHNINQPVTFFARIAADTNGAAFPGAVAVAFQPVLPGQWTTVSIDIDPNNPAFVSFSGSDFESIFSRVGFIQIGLAAPDGLLGDPSLFSVDLDNVSIVPAPAGLALLVPGLIATRRRRG